MGQTMIKAMHFLVTGLVQGVGFRFASSEKARQLGICGWVKNRQDGKVELWAEGSAVALDQLTIWLQQGPPAARVDHVTIERADIKQYTEFQIKD